LAGGMTSTLCLIVPNPFLPAPLSALWGPIAHYTNSEQLGQEENKGLRSSTGGLGGYIAHYYGSLGLQRPFQKERPQGSGCLIPDSLGPLNGGLPSRPGGDYEPGPPSGYSLMGAGGLETRPRHQPG